MANRDVEKPGENVNWNEVGSALDGFLKTSSDCLTSDQIELLRRMRLLAEIDKNKAADFLNNEGDNLREAVALRIIDGEVDPVVAQTLLRVFSENEVMTDFYNQFGNCYKCGNRKNRNTDCIQILKQNRGLSKLMEDNPVRKLSEGSDIVLGEKLGHVVDVVDRKDFERLRKYRPTNNKIYIFGLVKPPFYNGDKPNISHIQIATNLQRSNDKLAVINSSYEDGRVNIEEDVCTYLATHQFERVYVTEIDLDKPHAGTQFEREPTFVSDGYHEAAYSRPKIYDLPIQLREFELIGEDESVQIDDEECRVLELVSDNRALSYLTIITAMREGKIGQFQNIKEAIAFKILYDPEGRSLGLHQVRRVVAPLFSEWLDSIDKKTAGAIGDGVYELWEKHQTGKPVEWSDIVPFLNSYDITEMRYTNVTVSTVCAYLLIKHLYEDQLLGAYATYGETFYGIGEQPEVMIAIGKAYRANMDVMIRGSQQYRIAEVAHKLGLVDDNFEFTNAAKATPEYKRYISEVEKVNKGGKYRTQFLIDGYKGIQTQHVAYMCYKYANPGGEISLEEFKKAYAGSRTDILSQKSDAVVEMHKIYEDLFGEKPHLLMTEGELRERSTRTPLRASQLSFANEGLWVVSHFRKLAEENWTAINRQTSGDGRSNPVLEEVLRERSLRTGEISKIPERQGTRFASLIYNLPDSAWYKKYPDLIMAACFENGLFSLEERSNGDGSWIKKTQDFIAKLFSVNLSQIEKELGTKFKNERARTEIAVLSSIIGVDRIVHAIQSGIAPDKLLNFVGGKKGTRLSIYAQSFDRLRSRFAIKDQSLLEHKERLTDREKREKFTLEVFDVARQEAEKRGLSLNFAIAATSMACLECFWGREKSQHGTPTLYTVANNIFSIKYDNREYTEDEYRNQDPGEPYRIHHTVEYFNQDNPTEGTRHYLAFKRYAYIEESVEDFFDLIERRYPLTTDVDLQSREEPCPEDQEKLVSTIVSEGYATDPKYASLTMGVAQSVQKILRNYGAII